MPDALQSRGPFFVWERTDEAGAPTGAYTVGTVIGYDNKTRKDIIVNVGGDTTKDNATQACGILNRAVALWEARGKRERVLAKQKGRRVRRARDGRKVFG